MLKKMVAAHNLSEFQRYKLVLQEQGKWMSVQNEENLKMTNAWYWAFSSEIQLVSTIFSLNNHRFQVRPMSVRPPEKVIRKSTQGTFPLDLDTDIPTSSGWVKLRDLRFHHKVFGKDGKPYKINYMSPIVENDCYKIIFNEGNEIIADCNHLWSVRDTTTAKKQNKYKEKTTKELYDAYQKKNTTRNKYAIIITDPVQYEEKNLPIDPYLLGLWLGDGNSYSAQITCHKNDAPIYSEILTNKNIPHIVRFNDKRYINNRNIKLENSNEFNKLGLWKNKHIPDIYLTGSIEQRLELLRGLIDTDGHIDKYGKAKFYNTNHILLDNVYELVCSLGLKPKKNFYQHNKSWDRTRPANDVYVIQFRMDTRFKIANLPRKYERQKEVKRISEISYRFIKEIVPVESRKCRCISVNSPDHLFLVTKSYVPTHNTEGEVLGTLHGMIFGYYPQGVYYLFPNKDKVSDFSKSRFKPLIDENKKTIGQFVKGTDSATLKRINRAFLFFRSGRLSQDIGSRGDMKSSANLKGDPADHAVFDEYDEMDMKAEEFVDGRLAKSAIGTKTFLANPTLPDYASDKKFQLSSQEYWHCKCAHCGWWTCLDLEEYWPEDGSPCLAIRWKTIKGGKKVAYRACRHCGGELDPRYGEWVAKRPDITDIIGFTIGHASYPWINVTKLLRDWEKPGVDRGNYIRLRLGRAYVEAENRLTHQQVYNCCGRQGMFDSDKGPCSMGVDQGGAQGDLFHVVVGKKLQIHSTITAQILKISVVKGWPELYSYMNRYNVSRCVIDGLPNQKGARAFAKSFKGRVYLSYFNENQKGSYAWNEKEFTVSSNRTEAMDAAHEEIQYERLLLPFRTEIIETYANHCHATAKKLEEDEETGTQRYVYIPKLGGPDHFRLAQTYETMAREGKSRQRYQ